MLAVCRLIIFGVSLGYDRVGHMIRFYKARTLTLAITFVQVVPGLSYFTGVFHMIRPFSGYQQF